MTFEWDENKNRENKKKHEGISFEIATQVFLDSKRLERFDKEHSTEFEERYDVLGLVEDILFVVFTERKNNIRIISARKATKEEQYEYYKDYDAR